MSDRRPNAVDAGPTTSSDVMDRPDSFDRPPPPWPATNEYLLLEFWMEEIERKKCEAATRWGRAP
jgi:hypothetical protein